MQYDIRRSTRISLPTSTFEKRESALHHSLILNPVVHLKASRFGYQTFSLTVCSSVDILAPRQNLLAENMSSTLVQSYCPRCGQKGTAREDEAQKVFGGDPTRLPHIFSSQTVVLFIREPSFAEVSPPLSQHYKSLLSPTKIRQRCTAHLFAMRDARQSQCLLRLLRYGTPSQKNVLEMLQKTKRMNERCLFLFGNRLRSGLVLASEDLGYCEAHDDDDYHTCYATRTHTRWSTNLCNTESFNNND